MSTAISADGTRIDYERYGDAGPAIIFIGGAIQHRAIDPDTTQTAKALAAQGFRAVDYDRRGRGSSGDTAPWAAAREVEDVAALIEAVGGPVTLYTSSSGAAVGLACARAGLAIERLAIYEPPFFAGVDLNAQLAELRTRLAAGDDEGALRYNLIEVIGLPVQAVDGMAGSPGWAAMVSVASTLVYDLASLAPINLDPDWKARWAEVTVPIVVYSGDATFPGMPEAADALADALPNATRRVMSGQGHSPAPASIVPALAEFLRS